MANSTQWIMGLGAIKSSWQRQTMKFGHDKGDQYSSLIFDNRGVGGSSKPWGRYSTSEMAKDLVEVLDHIGWTEKRSVNVIGVSMGGMIAQEVAYLIPERINSLALCSTVARLERTVPFLENLMNRVTLFLPKSLDKSLAMAAYNMFPDGWLDKPDQSVLPTRDTPKCLPPSNVSSWDEGEYGRYPTNYARFAAQEITKRQDTESFNRKGFMLQAVAAGWHHMSTERLKELGDKVGRERIVVLHGTEDRMLTFHHGEVLNRELQPGEYYPIKGAGHVLFLEDTEWHDGMLERLWKKANALAK